jgi:hypothetical protein
VPARSASTSAEPARAFTWTTLALDGISRLRALAIPG